MLTRNLRNKKARYICVYVHSFLRFSLRAATSLVFLVLVLAGVGVARAYVCVLKWYFKKQKENAESVNVCISLSRDVVFSFFFFLRSLSRSFVVFFFGASNRIYRSRPSPRQQQRDATPHSATNRSFFSHSHIDHLRERKIEVKRLREMAAIRVWRLFFIQRLRDLSRW